MLKVECESCNAPYQIDERRVPPSGLKMRCSKCGHSFLVRNDAATAGPGAQAEPAEGGAEPRPGVVGPAPRPAVTRNLKSTMVGVGGDGGFGRPPATGTASSDGPPRAPTSTATATPARPASGVLGAAQASPAAPAAGGFTGPGGLGKKTMMGVAPGAGSPQAPAGPPVSPFKPTVPALSSLKALAPGGSPSAGTPKGPGAGPALSSSLKPRTGVPTESLKRPPTPGAALPARPAAPPTSPGRPAISPPTPARPAAPPGAAPSTPAPPARPAGSPPARVSPGAPLAGRPLPSDFPAALGALEESDLPVISAGLAAPRPAATPGKAPVLAYKVPAAPVAPTAAPPLVQPAVPQAPDPGPSMNDLDFDLPAVAADLPVARSGPAPARAPAKPPPTFELDLPDPISDLPAARSSRGADLPVLRSPFGGDAARSPFGAEGPAPGSARPAPPAARMLVADLPVVRSPAAEASAAGFLSDLPVIAAHDRSALEAGLPVIAADLPQVADVRANLPVPAASLPARVDPRANLPAPQASLPVRFEGGLPSPAATLPVPLDSLPAPASSRGFGEIELPTFGDTVATVAMPPAGTASASSRSSGSFGLFGEIDLPHESPPSSSGTPAAATAAASASDSADFSDLQLDDKPRSIRPPRAQSLPPPILRSDAPKSAGGMSFGEVEIGPGGGEGGSIGLDAGDRVGLDAAREAPIGLAAASAPARTRGTQQGAGAQRKRSRVRTLGAVLAVLAVVGGAALQVTPYGAFGYLAIGDVLHAGDYRQAALAAITECDRAAASDTYDAAKAALEAVYGAQARSPRARALEAYAAFADYAATARFGPDTSRASRAQQLLAALPADAPVQYGDAASAAQAATGDDLPGARKAVDAASQGAAPTDPIQHDLALLAGELALAAHDGADAVAAFKRALAMGNDARAHFGLARSYDLTGDAADEKLELDATLAASPGHPGALTLRARPTVGAADPTQALADLALVVEGASRAKASPRELSRAYAVKAWVSLERGGATDAREAFAQAVAIDPRNVDALNGQGRLFLNEGRSTEALARFDTALGIDPGSAETIANDAEAKIDLERLADAKQQLVAARQRFPKSIPTLILLGRVEQHLGNADAAEADLRAAIALVDPARADAVLPYVALSKLLSERGHVDDGRAALEEAKKKLPASPALERAFGEMSELSGDYDGAIAHFEAALARDPKDATTHFRLGVALRRVRKFDQASAELDKVAAVDKDYPGLALERGLLFEESGDVQKAIEQFNGALAKAPDDPDLQLRVGAAYVAIGRPDEALPVLRKVLDKRPASAEAHHFIGRALMLQPGPEQSDAIRYLKRAVDLDPNRAEFHVYLAWAANDATPAQLELARDEIDKALAIDKVSPEAYWQRGVLERMEGADEDAIKDENHALVLRPSRYEAHATLAQCFEDKNQESAAMAEWARAIAGDVEPADAKSVRHPFWRFRYGKLLMEHGGPAVALAQLVPAVTTAEAIGPKPGWLAPLEFLTAEALRKTGKKAEAVDHYKRFLDIAPVNSPDRLDAQQALSALAPR
jgi:cellulose synthase operon protein C